MEPVLPITLALPERGSRQILRSMHQQMRTAIVDGRLSAGLRLPGSRTLAEQCGVSRNCAMAVYDLLLSEGLVAARAGGGTFVSDIYLADPPRAAADRTSLLLPRWRHAPTVLRPSAAAQFDYDFVVGLPDTTQFPFDTWRRLDARSLRQLERAPAEYAAPEGRAALRAAIAKHVSFARAVACSGTDVLVTSGAQQAFDLLARIFIEPGVTRVAIEDPGYPPLRWALESSGAVLVPVPVDAEGMVVDRIPADARLICVTPSHQFPMGPAMSLQRRMALLAFAREHGSLIIEDDYDGEFSHSSQPLDALKSLDRADSVFYVGTFSKSLFPGLRLGYVIAPAWARAALVGAKQRSDWHGAVAAQDTLAAFIDDGDLARHIRKMRQVYSQRKQILVQALQRHLPGKLSVIPSEGGLHIAALLGDEDQAMQVVAAAAEAGIRVEPLSQYALAAAPPNGLVFGLGLIPTHLIDQAVLRLTLSPPSGQ
ncbi:MULTISPECIES: PLP-dependent aminotransferase family protein [unclassified Duganella]|uniref:MocR-like pyridoxine biosynthesis transcription factor PdxR n=1 Tax=unclassified Duganella TaxID=2636909 RepID=UPI000E3405CD|nr:MULTISPECIES: PLP-dependent aminotransferase family protein [unclassified Duganella]RFP18506.1 PLP-dependent aminotransferase family protein [Duganella sp. BJB475]RFP35172.1 PLP-dependent aminotransferase family protein [Duganella sp. BJB476]